MTKGPLESKSGSNDRDDDDDDEDGDPLSGAFWYNLEKNKLL